MSRCSSVSVHGVHCRRGEHWPGMHHGAVECVDGYTRRVFWFDDRVLTMEQLTEEFRKAALRGDYIRGVSYTTPREHGGGLR